MAELPSILDSYGLSGKAAIVTGGAEGIGEEIARCLAGAGAVVAIADVNQAGARDAADRINRAGGEARAYLLDVSDEESVVAAVDAVRRDLGRLDILVNNAGVQDQALLEDISVALWTKLQSVNLLGPILMVREAARVMRADRTRGRIVNIASMGVAHPLKAGLLAYSATKAGVHGLTRNAAHELAKDGITVNSIFPGNIPTDGRMRSPLTPVSPDYVQRVQALPLGRVGKPGDIANAVLFFVAPAAEWITGQSLLVDGGQLIT